MSQLHDEGIKIIKQKLSQGEAKYRCFHTDHQGVLWFNNRVVVPKNHQLHKQILDEAHLSKFFEALHTIHKLMDRLSELIKFWKTCSELIIHYGTNWDKCLALAEFFYNNSYQSSLQMAPFEALYS
jgi:hypothetical protein